MCLPIIQSINAMRRMHPKRLTDFDIHADLLPTDRILQRWARSVGCGVPDEAWEYAPSRAPELPADAAVWVDRYVCACQYRMRMFLHSWYRGQDASAIIAKRFNVDRDAVYMLWRGYLAICRDDFLAEPCVEKLMQICEGKSRNSRAERVERSVFYRNTAS